MSVIEEVKVKSSHYLLSAIGVATALSWNTTIKEFLNETFPMPKSNFKANLIYSFSMILILVLLVYILPSTEPELPPKTQERLIQIHGPM